MTPGDTIQPTSPGQAPSNGLVTARHADCNLGPALLHYLATGDNGGNSWYDQHYADDVGASVPQARAIADKAIQDCDAYLDQQATSAAQATSQRAAATSDAQKQQFDAALQRQQVASCQSIGGDFILEYGPSCRSRVPGHVVGQDAVNCSNDAVIVFAPSTSSTISQDQLAQARKKYPGCWPG